MYYINHWSKLSVIVVYVGLDVQKNIYLIYNSVTTFIDKLILRAQTDELERNISEKENKFV